MNTDNYIIRQAKELAKTPQIEYDPVHHLNEGSVKEIETRSHPLKLFGEDITHLAIMQDPKTKDLRVLTTLTEETFPNFGPGKYCAVLTTDEALRHAYLITSYKN